VGKAAKLRAARRAEETRREVQRDHSSLAALVPSPPAPPSPMRPVAPAGPVVMTVRQLGGLRAYLQARTWGYPVDHRYRIFSLLIRAYRHNLGITQAEAAKRHGVSAASWSMWERGRTIPQPHILDRLSGPVSRMVVRVSDRVDARRRAYDVDEDELLADEPLPVRRGRPASGRKEALARSQARAAARRSKREVVTRAG
jgi:transcriptional regulator with XRE-family HTH domain